MKIYGVTFIDDSADCTIKSETRLFKTKEEMLEAAWEQFSNEYQYDIDNDQLDESISEPHIPDKKDFLLRLVNCCYDYYVRYDSSYQVEIFVTEL